MRGKADRTKNAARLVLVLNAKTIATYKSHKAITNSNSNGIN
jgi:hypothetical protein